MHSLVAYLVKFVVTNILKEFEALEFAIHLNVRAAVNLANISSKIAATKEHKYEVVFIDLEQDNKKPFPRSSVIADALLMIRN